VGTRARLSHLSDIVQAWVPREAASSAAPRWSPPAVRVLLATGLGAASSSLLLRGDRNRQIDVREGREASSPPWTFQFASTNLVFELGLVLWLFLGWRFHARRVRRRHHPDRP